MRVGVGRLLPKVDERGGGGGIGLELGPAVDAIPHPASGARDPPLATGSPPSSDTGGIVPNRGTAGSSRGVVPGPAQTTYPVIIPFLHPSMVASPAEALVNLLPWAGPGLKPHAGGRVRG